MLFPRSKSLEIRRGRGTLSQTVGTDASKPQCSSWSLQAVGPFAKSVPTTRRDSAPGCFDACGDQARNTSSPCWVDCFYKAALGPDSGRYGGAVAGMAMDDLVAAWEKPFLPEDQGGCPPQAELPSPWL